MIATVFIFNRSNHRIQKINKENQRVKSCNSCISVNARLTSQCVTPLCADQDRGVAAPPAALPFNLLKGRAKRAPQLPPPACAGFPALRRGFGDRQKLDALRQFAGLIPKPPLRSGEGKRGKSVKGDSPVPNARAALQFLEGRSCISRRVKN